MAETNAARAASRACSDSSEGEAGPDERSEEQTNAARAASRACSDSSEGEAGPDERSEEQTIDVLVGRVGKAHGLRGEVTVQTTTDSPEQRFAPGSRLRSEAGRVLTVRSHRLQSGTRVIAFEQVTDRSAAEALRGTELWAGIPSDLTESDGGEFHDTSLIGLDVVSPEGSPLGAVARILHLPAQDLLVIATAAGERLVPFVEALVPEVDLAAGRVVVTPIPGLLDDEVSPVEPRGTGPGGTTDAP